MTKILANKLKKIMIVVIALTQCGFIRGRCGSNNIIIAQKVIHKMRYAKDKKGFMAIKIDLEKAYDHLDWNFVVDFLRDLGLNDQFVSLVWHRISSISMNIL